VHKEAIVIAVLMRAEAGDGVRHRNESQQHSAVHSQVCGRLQVTWKKEPGRPGCTICCSRRCSIVAQSAAQCLVRRAAERQGGCAQAGRLLRTGMLRPVSTGKRTTERYASWGAVIRNQQTFDASDESTEGADRGWAFPVPHPGLWPRYRRARLNKIPQAGVRRRAELLSNNWMDCRLCGATCTGSFWQSQKHKRRTAGARFPASVRFEPPA